MKSCCVFGCNNNASMPGISLFQFPGVNEQERRKRWETSTKRANFVSSDGKYICCAHFSEDDMKVHRTKKCLIADAVPTIFPWKQPNKRRKLEYHKTAVENDETSQSESVSVSDKQECMEKATQTNNPVINFGYKYLRDHKDTSLLQFHTGFENCQMFDVVLNLILPEKNRRNLLYYGTKVRKTGISGQEFFELGEVNEAEHFIFNDGDQKGSTMPEDCYKLSVEDEFLLVLMKLRLGVFYKDLSTRFDVSVTSVHRIFYTWINLMYFRLGSVNVFPHRDVIIKNMTSEFRTDYSTSMIIIDCTEIKVQTPSSMVRQSQTFSNYKSTNTLKGLIGVDSKGAIMFASQLYTGCISDKEICKRSGFLNLLQYKVTAGELQKGDAIMADKGFNITSELQSMGISLNMPPFLGNRRQFDEDEVIRTQTIARHRIQVERAIRKIRQFHFFDKKIPVNMLGIVNQIWAVCCMLCNFQRPILSSEKD